MATFTKRTRKDGSVAHRAMIRVKRDGKLLYQKAHTFNRLASAKKWATRLEAKLNEPGEIKKMAHSGVTISLLISLYIADHGARFGRTKYTDLQFIKDSEVAKVNALILTAEQVIAHIKMRRKTVSASTALNDLIWLKAIWRFGKIERGIPLDYTPIDDAREYCYREKLIAKSKKRTRRPAQDELERLSAYFGGKRGQYPMQDIMWFALHSARRQAEICRILWSDNWNEQMTGLVRDAKHPTRKEGNHRRFKYTQEAWDIVQRQPRTDARIFPCDPKTVGTYFRQACHTLGIEDLRFHDLRHEATSRLFEAGYEIVEVQQFTLHESWAVLSRYTHLRPEGVVLR